MSKQIRTYLSHFFLGVLLLSSCGMPASSATLPMVNVYAASTATPWLVNIYDCADRVAAISRVDDPNSAQIRLQIGEPKFLSGFAYQIDQEEILVVSSRVSPLGNLTLEQVQALFMGLGNPTVQVWMYASDTDVQRVFEQFGMKGRSVAPSINIALTPQQMSDILVNQENTVGILPRHWKAGDAREIYSVAKVPVLALTQTEPQGIVKQLIACMQK